MAQVHGAAKAAGAAAKADAQLVKDSLREGAGAVTEHGAGIDAMMNALGMGSGIVAGAPVTATT